MRTSPVLLVLVALLAAHAHGVAGRGVAKNNGHQSSSGPMAEQDPTAAATQLLSKLLRPKHAAALPDKDDDGVVTAILAAGEEEDQQIDLGLMATAAEEAVAGVRPASTSAQTSEDGAVDDQADADAADAADQAEAAAAEAADAAALDETGEDDVELPEDAQLLMADLLASEDDDGEGAAAIADAQVDRLPEDRIAHAEAELEAAAETGDAAKLVEAVAAGEMALDVADEGDFPVPDPISTALLVGEEEEGEDDLEAMALGVDEDEEAAAAAADALEGQELQQDLTELMRDTVLRNIIASVTTSLPEDVGSEGVAEEDWQDELDVIAGQPDVMTSTTNVYSTVVVTTAGGRGGWLRQPLTMLLHVVDVVVSSTQPVFTSLSGSGTEGDDVDPVEGGYAYDDSETGYFTVEGGDDEEEVAWLADEGQAQEYGVELEAAIEAGLPFRGAGQAVAGAGLQTAYWWSATAVPPYGRPMPATGDDALSDSDNHTGAVLLAGLLLATAAMLVGFVRTFLQLRRSMRPELLVPFIMEHQGELRHGYMVLDQEQLSLAAAAAVAGSGSQGAGAMPAAGWKVHGATPVVAHQTGDDEKAQAQRQWQQQQALVQQQLLARLAEQGGCNGQQP